MISGWGVIDVSDDLSRNLLTPLTHRKTVLRDVKGAFSLLSSEITHTGVSVSYPRAVSAPV